MSDKRKPQIEHLEELGVFQCVDCGEFSEVSAEKIRHLRSCEPGAAAKWERFYEEAYEMGD